MKLYTKGGDDGSTGLFGGKRVLKCAVRVHAYGTVDETNAALGMIIAECGDEQTVSALTQIQSDLFLIGSELAAPEPDSAVPRVDKEMIGRLERWIDEACAEAPALRSFVLPGGGPTAAGLHFARTVCRRAERAVVALAQEEAGSPVSRQVIIYLNRLSDLLFALARRANHRAGIPDQPWVAPRRSRGG